jgi:hypothetical protein
MSKQVRKQKTSQEPVTRKALPSDKRQQWQTPKMEDVSAEVMAQPYIRFT